jgi:hypothetical protein
MIAPNLAKLMSQENQEYYRKTGQLPDPKKANRALQRNERQEQRVFSAWMHMKGILYVNPRADQKSTIAIGWPDFSVFLDGARTIFIEMKSGDGKCSPEQIARQEQLKQIGHAVYVAWSADEAIKIVRKHLEEPRRDMSGPGRAWPG